MKAVTKSHQQPILAVQLSATATACDHNCYHAQKKSTIIRDLKPGALCEHPATQPCQS